MDNVRPVDDSARYGHGHDDFRYSYFGNVFHHGLHKHYYDDPQHASSGHDDDENALICVDLADYGLFVSSVYAGAGRCCHHDFDGSSLWYSLL